MAASSVSSSLRNVTAKSFSLVLIDVNQNRSTLYLDLRQELRSILDSFETFHDRNQCETYLRATPDCGHHVILVGEETVNEFIASIHDLNQVLKIYIYDVEQTITPTIYSEKYPKVKHGGYFREMSHLIVEVTDDRKRWHHVGEPLTFSMFNISNHVERSSLNINGSFLHFQMLIDLLLRLKTRENNRVEFIEQCRKRYADQRTDLAVIDEFERSYRPENAVWWYTRDSFLYRLLNESLRLQDIQWIFRFRFFIQDIHQILKELNEEHHSTRTYAEVFRHQLMSPDEISQLKSSIGGLISFLSFLSTTRSREYAKQSLGEDPTVYQGTKPVLFEIKLIDYLKSPAKPYGDVTGRSAFGYGEQETLFMIGSLFRLESWRMENFITVFCLTQCAESDTDEWKGLVDQMKTEIGIGTDDTLLTLGTLLWKSSRYDQAEEFYHRMIQELSPGDTLIPNCYQGLGFVAAAKGNLEQALAWQRKVLDFYQLQQRPADYCLGIVWNSIGNIQWRRQQYPLALEAYDRAKAIFSSHHDRDLASCLNNMGNVYEETGQYEKALETHQQAIALRESILPPNHPELGISYHNIANVYRQLGRITEARFFVKRALKIFEKSLRSNDPSIAATYRTLAGLEFDSGADRQGLRYLEQAAGILRETLPADHPALEEIHLTILKVMRAIDGLV